MPVEAFPTFIARELIRRRTTLLMPPELSTETSARVLLIQARNTPHIERQELECFLERTELASDQIVAVNLVHTPLSPCLPAGVEAVLIGGAGEYSAVEEYPWTPALLDFVRMLYANSVPTFGSCWGHQVIARALGGTVIHDSRRAELGGGTVTLTDAGRRDELFSTLPDTFNVNMGHHDRVVKLPPGSVELAYNDSQPNQAFRMRGRPLFGTQFHSELNAARTRERLEAYREYYSEIGSDEHFETILHGLLETTEVDHLLREFIVLYVGCRTA